MRRLLSLAFRVLPLLILQLQPVALRAASVDPLFASNTRLQIALDGPFGLIERERDKEKEYSGTLSYIGPTGKPVVLDAKFQVRGNNRLRRDVCRYAQLWVNVKTRQAKGTLFENQDRIKLVVQCSPEQRYVDYIVREHQTYQMFNQLTAQSFAARLVQVTYRDSDKGTEPRTGFGIFIEHQKRLAERLHLQDVEVGKIGVAKLDPAQANLVATFMYMIANVDYSMLSGQDGEECCHNVRPLDDGKGHYVPIPYDFDSSGLVDASYATPSAQLNQRSIRQRMYRGFCAHSDLMTGTLARFREKRPAIATILADTTYTSPAQATRTQDFINGFYKLIDEPVTVNAELLGKCR